MSAHDDGAAQSEQRLVTVDLIGLPLDVAHRSNEHHATLTRELAFVDAAFDPATIPAKLLSLSLVMPQDVLAFRRWASSQFSTQIRSGAPPTAWEDFASAAVDPTPAAPARPGRITVDEDLDLGGRSSTCRSRSSGRSSLRASTTCWSTPEQPAPSGGCDASPSQREALSRLRP